MPCRTAGERSLMALWITTAVAVNQWKISILSDFLPKTCVAVSRYAHKAPVSRRGGQLAMAEILIL